MTIDIVYTGIVKHLTKVILYKTGMLNSSRNHTHNPLARLEDFFSRVIWPHSISRLPPSVCNNVPFVFAIIAESLLLDRSWHRLS
jgi:hypothetical protein